MPDIATEGPETGLQRERTTMAWQRTALGFGGVSALLLHHARGDIVLSVTGGTGLLAALTLLLVVEARAVRSHSEVGSENASMGRTGVRAVSLGTVLLALAAVIVVLGAAPQP